MGAERAHLLLALEGHGRGVGLLRGPAGGDRLGAGVEPHTLGAVDVGVTQARLIPPPEGGEYLFFWRIISATFTARFTGSAWTIRRSNF